MAEDAESYLVVSDLVQEVDRERVRERGSPRRE